MAKRLGDLVNLKSGAAAVAKALDISARTVTRWLVLGRKGGSAPEVAHLIAMHEQYKWSPNFVLLGLGAPFSDTTRRPDEIAYDLRAEILRRITAGMPAQFATLAAEVLPKEDALLEDVAERYFKELTRIAFALGERDSSIAERTKDLVKAAVAPSVGLKKLRGVVLDEAKAIELALVPYSSRPLLRVKPENKQR